MTVVLVSTRADVRRAAAWLARRRTEPAKVIAFELEAQHELDRLGVPLYAFDEHVDDKRFGEVTELAFAWATEWRTEPAVAAALMFEAWPLAERWSTPFTMSSSRLFGRQPLCEPFWDGKDPGD